MAEPSTGHLAPLPTAIRRIAFLGTPDEAAVVLRSLAASPIEVAIVVTQPDRRRGRGSKLVPSPVKAAALELGLDVTDDLEAVTSAGVDLAVVVAYGRIIPRRLLEQVPMINLHFSLLPRWRGAAPVERAILAGDEQTGVGLMVVAEGLDTGDVHAEIKVPIGDETAAELRRRLAGIGADLVVDALVSGLDEPRPQQGEPTYAAKLAKDEFRLDFTRPAAEVARRVRIGRAWTTFRGVRLGVEAVTVDPSTEGRPGRLVGPDGLNVGTGDGSVVLVEVKPEGKRTMAARDWANGVGPVTGEDLGS